MTENSQANQIDWQRLYQVCVGMIGIQPNMFWNMSPREVFLAIDGFKEFNGAEKETPLSRNELDKLMELHPD